MLHNAEKTRRTRAELGRLSPLAAADVGLTTAMTASVRPRYPPDAILMPADPVFAEILDLTHCGNILTRCAVAYAHRVAAVRMVRLVDAGEKPYVAPGAAATDGDWRLRTAEGGKGAVVPAGHPRLQR